jgi:protein O-GlcNAc transferase
MSEASAAQGVELLRSRLAREPINARLWHELAMLALQLGRLPDAVAAATGAVTFAPDGIEPRLGLALALSGSADFARAIAHYERAVQLAPAHTHALLGLASAYAAVGLFEDAARLGRQVLEIEPDNAAAKLVVAMAGSARDPGKAVETRAAARPAFDEAVRLEREGQPARALETLTLAARRWPGVAPIHYRIGCLLQDAGQGEAAMSHHELAARLQPDLFGAVHNAGKLAAGFGLVDRARRYLTQAVRLRPQDGISMRLELLTDAIHPSRQAILSARERFEQGLDRLLERPTCIEDPLNKADLPTFYLAYHGLPNRDLQIKLARAFARSVPDLEWQAPHCLAAQRRAGRIRIGFISQFLRTHSIGKVARGLIAGLSREHFEVYALNIPPVVLDETARWIQAHSDHWVVLADSLTAARAQIAALELDILFYQDIGMEPFSYLLAYARLARVQCVSFGHPDTTGIPAMDYYVSNDLYEPPGASGHYSERLFQLHDLPTLAYYYAPPMPQAAANRAALGLPADVRLYICPQALFKLHPDFDDLMRRILERDGAGRILLFSGYCEEWSVLLQRRFRRTMPDVADRVRFLPRQPHERFLQIVSLADVMLDTVHFNGMITSIEALSVGTPVVTLPGALQRGRATQAMYRAMGIEGMVAGNAEDYADLACDIAMNSDRQQALRRLIAERRHLLFEDRRAISEFERFFLAAHLESIGQDARA